MSSPSKCAGSSIGSDCPPTPPPTCAPKRNCPPSPPSTPRAASQHQTFATWDDFVRAAKDNSLRSHPKDALPIALLQRALEHASDDGNWSLADVKKGWKWPTCKTTGGRTLEGHFVLTESRVKRVTIETAREKK